MIAAHGATPEGCEKFRKARKKFVHADKFREIGDLTVSAIGLGTYLGDYDDPTDSLYQEAILKAVELGCNFIDTAINYRCQRSERVIGRALAKLFKGKKINRNQIVVASKGGFIPFDNEPASNIQEYIRKQWIETSVVKESDIVSSCHCLKPDFIQNQIDQSLDNLGLETLDVYYLHNPETQLPIIGEQEFYKRLYEVFCLLEDNVKKGKIQFYGLATWKAFREHEGIAEAVSLEKVVALAEKANSKHHHFKVIQLPYNLAMLEAVGVASQTYEGQTYPIMTAAAQHGIHIVTSAPLLQGQLLQLSANLASKIPGQLNLAQKSLQFVSSTPQVSSTLVGMKQVKHVEENLKVLKNADWDLPTLQRVCDLVTGG